MKPDKKEEEKKPVEGVPQDELERAIAEFKVEDLETPIEKESRGFVTLLTHFLKNLTPEEAKAKVNATLSTKDIFEEADRHQGQYVRIVGRLIQLYPEYINATTPTGTEVVYLGILESFQPPNPNRTFYFYLPEKPRDPKTGEGTPSGP